MSYNLTVYTKTIHHTDNYTSNVYDMYRLAYRENIDKINEYAKNSFHFIDDWMDAVSAEREVSLPILAILIIELENNPNKYKKLNPKNGWGNYEGALKFLKQAYEVMLKNKDAVIEVDC